MKTSHIGIFTFADTQSDISSGAKRLQEAAQNMGHVAHIYYESLFTFEYSADVFNIKYNGVPFEVPDVIIVRPNFIEEPMLHAATLEALRELNIPMINGNTTALLTAKEKLMQHMVFKKAGIPMPPWAIVRDPRHALEEAKRISFPVIIKVPFGTHGKGVFYATDPETFSPITEYLHVRDNNPIIIEKFISEAHRSDLRVFVLENKIIAAMERKARPEDVRANASLGGKGFPVTLTKEEQELALKATRITGLDLAGVDILRSNKGPLVIEINANPGFSELEKATGVDIAKCIIEHAVAKK